MKNIYLSISILLGVFTSCDRVLDDISFHVNVEDKVYNVGEPVTFSFTGNPDFITLYSGEEGSNYNNRNRTEIAMEDIESATFSFSVARQYGLQLNTLEVALSNSFQGLSKKDIEADYNAIQDTEWDMLTDTNIELEKAPATPTSPMTITPIDISNYLNHFVFALHYTGTSGSTQRTWTLQDFGIVCKLKSGKEIKSGKADELNFAAFDVRTYNENQNPYTFILSGSSLKGTWLGINMVSKNQIQMQGGGSTEKDNDDWLISSPIKLNSCTPDLGVAIKDMSVKLDSYEYIFNEPGTYEVVFVATNENYEGRHQVIRKKTIVVQEVG